MKLHHEIAASAIGACALILTLASTASAQDPAGEGPALGSERVTQVQVEGGLGLKAIRQAGMRIFATPFNDMDGYGDGPMNPVDTTSPGGRPSLQDNGTFLRVNGLDSQTCFECHAVRSFATIPPSMAIGGAGTGNDNVLFQPTKIDVTDRHGNGFAAFNGRFINPPFVFGAGALQLIAKEMTAELQELALLAVANPGTEIALTTKGVNFGSIVFEGGLLDTSGVEGIDTDLVVRPFGRKGEFATVRGFAQGAMQFHFGMQPAEVVGQGVDDDGDGVSDEILVGELSALSIFMATLEPPFQEPLTREVLSGGLLFEAIGCAGCHLPFMESQSSVLTYSFPEVDSAPFANVFYATDLSQPPASFETTPGGGIAAAIFSDLKRHYMGEDLAEDFGGALDRQFITARLWGVADSAPYLHDGRAMTLTEAIVAHGGEAKDSRDLFLSLSDGRRRRVLSFLRSLRTPLAPAADILPK